MSIQFFSDLPRRTSRGGLYNRTYAMATMFPQHFTIAIALLLLSLAACTFDFAIAGSYYCEYRNTVEIHISSRAVKEATLVPEYEFLSTVSHPPAVETCRWVVKCAGQDTVGQLVLLGQQAVSQDSLAASGNTNGSFMRYQLEGKDHDVTPGLVRGVSIGPNDACKISVSYINGSQHPPRLRAVLLQPGRDAREFLSFKDDFYANSSARETFKLAAGNIKGTAQMASFISEAEIDSLIAANSAIPSFWRPLNLAEPVRLAMFYGPDDGAVLTLIFNQTACRLQPLPQFKQFRVTESSSSSSGPADLLCGSLRLAVNGSASLNWTVEFVSCSTPMRSLVRFPGAGSPSSLPAASSCDLVNLSLTAARESLRPVVAQSNGQASAPSLSKHSSIIIVSVCAVMLLASCYAS